MGKRETLEQIGLGAMGITFFNSDKLIEIANAAQAATIILSLLFICIPTGIWATLRAWQSIEKFINRKKDNGGV